jgi:sorbitol/mannitol transport system permease protein
MATASATGSNGAAMRKAGDWARRAPLLPALIFVIAMTQLPFVATVVISFMNWNAYYPDERGFTGFDNYVSTFTDTNARSAVIVTIVLTTSVVLLSLLLGLGIALLLDRKFRGRSVVRTMMITPFLIVPVAAALLWKHALYNPEYGLFNGLLKWVFGPDAPQPDWITNNPLWSIIAALVWQWTPFMMLILLAGLQSRPLDVVEAARIDGAGPMRFFKDVLVPLSTTSIAALFVIQFIYGWNQYLWPLLVTTDESRYPIVMGIKRMFVGGDAANEWNVIMATAVLAMIPPALVVLLMQKWFVKGLVDAEK